ncbi:MAG TPA: secretion system protein E, partial [Methanoculleus sp.]|nr:secretion system protein E [Methanoculleus sp.]
DTFSYTGRSRIFAEIMEYRGWGLKRLEEELQTRRTILRAMLDQGIRDYRSVARIIQAWTISPETVLSSIDDLGELIR